MRRIILDRTHPPQGPDDVEEFGAPKWLHTKQAAQKIREVWTAAGPMNAWLDVHVGPSDLPPEDRPF